MSDLDPGLQSVEPVVAVDSREAPDDAVRAGSAARPARAASRWLLVALVCLGPTTVATAQLRPVPSVAMEGMEPAVREQIENQRDRLARLADDDSVPRPVLGQAYGELGQLYLLYDLSEPAAAALANASSLDQGQPRWPYLLGTLHELEGRMEPARTSYRDALARSGDDPSSLPIIARLVRVLLPAASEGDQVSPEIERLLARLEGPGLTEADYGAYAAFARGELASARGEHAQAAQWFSRALAAQPHANLLHYRLALAHRQTGDLDRARFHLENRGDREVSFPDPVVADLRSQAQGAGAQLMLGRIALSTGDLEEAERRFRAALDIEPSSAAALQSLGNLHRRRGDLDRALEAYERALKSTPDDVRLRLFVARLLLRRADRPGPEERATAGAASAPDADLERALGHLEEAALLAPGQIAIQVEWADALQRATRFTDAEQVYQRALSRAPGEFDLQYLRAQNASREIAHLGTVDQLTTEALDAIGARGREALTAFRSGLETSGKSLPPDVEVELGLLELRLGDSVPGRERLARVLDTADLASAQRARAAFHLGNEAAQRADLDGATAFLERAVELEPDLREARLNLARLLEGRGAVDAATSHYRALLDTNAEDHAARFALAESRLRAGRYGDAKALLMEGLDLAPGTPAFAQLLVRIVVAAPDETVRDGSLGLDLAQRLFDALPTTEHAESLAMALAEVGRFDDAVRWQSRVLEELQSQGRPTTVAAERLEAYRNEQRIWGWGPAGATGPSPDGNEAAAPPR